MGFLSAQSNSDSTFEGYDQRPSIPLDEIEQVITRLKEVHPNILIFVDNCYGEFVERREPIECGADLIAGSLIKTLAVV